MEKPRLTRRQFILVLATLSGSLTLTGIYRLLSKAAALTKANTYLPLLAKARGVASTPTATVTRTPVTTTDATPSPTKTRTLTPTVNGTATPSPTKTRTLTPTVNGTATPIESPTTTQTNQPPGPLAGKVIHIRNTNATNWDGNIPFYNSSAVNQSVVNTMVFEGLKNLTNQTSWGNIWQVLFGRVQPGGYTPGQKIAIKVNFNDSDRDNNNCSAHNNTIDALPQPVIALLNGLVAAGVQPTDVIVYDATGGSYGNTNPGRIIPDYFRNPITNAYSGVNFVGLNDCNVTPASFGKDPSLTVTFNDPNNYLLDRHLADILYNATYLINMPILKGHGGDSDIPVTLSFKNHFGSIDYVYGGPGPHDNLHEFVSLPQGQYHSNYSPLVDINKNPNIKNKTILIAGDGLYGSWAVSPEQNWTIFGNDAANSLFFAVDPVAVDCVMTDLIHAEGWFSDLRGYDFLFCAQEAGLGLCEGTRANPGGKPLQQPFGSGYSTISYTRIDL